MYDVPSPAKILNHIELFNNDLAQPNTAEAINNVYKLPSIERVVRYLHGAAGFPTKSTWISAIFKGNFLTWLLINVKNVNKNFPESEDTQKGHQHNQRQGVRPTNRKSLSALAALAASALPSTKPLETGNTDAAGTANADVDIAPTIEKEKDILLYFYDTRDTVYTDLTGKFSPCSSRGNNYQLIGVDIDSNSSWIEPVRSRSTNNLITARCAVLTCMKAQGIVPQHQILDNEISKAYKEEITLTNMTY